MNTILVDSSAWIEYFKTYEDYAFIDDLIDNNSICTNDLILTELLPSMIHRKENHLIALLNSVVKYEVEINWKELQNIQVMNYKHGYNDIGITDLIIAQNCLQNNLSLVARDKHFNEMAEYLPLKMYK
ncbi:PIN domain-containing protein [Leadbettera azotonutricia]|uniref:PIN domain protein n=1 Tax=Leadbettera azotonutricia (strain ATCC BAA-888 / DSM 13862 / ZAS-9) TaxID=545695 RepID=F5YD88_LEAAZ|nr:PIN domain-containing protein [Leadbettera azotonutricia]AEF81555.1 PIN domain protein [Leadbettera azotonutricia ZAS-9]